MANYLSVYLSSSARTWLLGLPVGLIRSWNHLHWLFTSNFCATCTRLRVDWDVIPEVDDKSIVMFFKKVP
jgi:hypothetical protein